MNKDPNTSNLPKLDADEEKHLTAYLQKMLRIRAITSPVSTIQRQLEDIEEFRKQQRAAKKINERKARQKEAARKKDINKP
jgi:hypothetical protein